MIIGANATAIIFEVGVIDGETADVSSMPCGPARNS